MPFITEELWGSMGERGENLLIHAKWPEPGVGLDDGVKAEVERLIEIVADVRSQRVDLNVPASAMLSTSIINSSGTDLAILNRYSGALKRLARIEPSQIVVEPDHISASATAKFEELKGDASESLASFRLLSRDLELFCFLKSGFADTTAERTRITNAIAAITKERDALSGRLNNPAFVEKAKPEAVEKARADHAEKSAEVERLQAALARLG